MRVKVVAVRNDETVDFVERFGPWEQRGGVTVGTNAEVDQLDGRGRSNQFVVGVRRVLDSATVAYMPWTARAATWSSRVRRA